MKEFTTKSGVDVVINDVPWPEAKRLKMAIQHELSAAGLKINLGTDVTELISVFMKVDGSKAVDDALWPCLARCTYAGNKITEKLFDDNIEARKDYYEIVLGNIEVNIRPFFDSLYSQFKAWMAAAAAKKKESVPT